MARKTRVVSPAEILNTLVEGLQRTAVAPSISAYKPLPHQAKFHQSEKHGKLFIGGNRSGKTVGGSAESVWWLTGRHPFRKLKPPPIYGRAIGVDFDDGVEKILKPEYKKWMPPSLLINGSWEDSFSRQLRTLTLTNGSTVEFMSYDQDVDKFAGTSRDFVHFDEEPPKDIFDENMLRLADVAGSWWCTMTPLIELSWTLDTLYEPGITGQDPDLDVFVVDTSENTYVSEDALERALKYLSEEDKKARKAGQYISHTGLVYGGHFGSENICEDILTHDKWPLYQNHWLHFAMLDHGYANPTAILLGCVDHDEQIIIYDEIYESQKLPAELAERYFERIEQLGITPIYIVADPSIKNSIPVSRKGGEGATSIQNEYADAGLYLSLGNNDVRGGITRVQGRFSKKLLKISERCEKTLWEIPRYRWDKFASSKIAQRKNAKETPMKKDDHALDALRYGVASRPALDWEVDLSAGNVFNFPVAVSDRDGNYDWAIAAEATKRYDHYDPVLGDQW